jgi:hypothetical protein
VMNGNSTFGASFSDETLHRPQIERGKRPLL